MNLIVDANIIFSSLIKNSFTINLLFHPILELYAPEFLFEELSKYKEEILSKTHRSNEDFTKIFFDLKEVIKLVPNTETKDFIDNARLISPDPNDCDYFALALKLNCPIWSNDKKLKEQNKVRIYSTEELAELLQK